MLGRLLAGLALACALAPGGERAGAAPIRSDAPLWPMAGEGVWPRLVTDEDGTAFESVVPTGDWRLTPKDCPAKPGADCVTWLRLRPLSFVRGGFVLREARTRAGLNAAVGEPAVLAELPQTDPPREQAAFALQIGFRGGSRYLVLTGRHERFEVSSFDCAGAGAESWRLLGYRQRAAAGRGHVRTDYCAVRTRAGLIELMRRPAVDPAVLELVAASKDGTPDRSD